MDDLQFANSICDAFSGAVLPPAHVDDPDLTTPPESPSKQIAHAHVTAPPVLPATSADLAHDQGQKRQVVSAEQSPSGKAPLKYPRRQLEYSTTTMPPPPSPAPTLESLSSLIQSSLASNASIVSNFNERFDEKERKEDERFATLHGEIKTVIQEHGQQLDDHESRITAVESLAADLQRKLNDYSVSYSSRMSMSSSSHVEDPSFSQGSSTPAPLSFPKAARTDVDERIKQSRAAEALNAKSLVVFHARPHIGELSDREFAERVVGLFDGKYAKVVDVTWIGQGLVHLRITLDQPVAEEIGRSFWSNARTYQVKYSLAPCRGPILRDAISRMRAVLEALRRHSELAGRRLTSTSARFIGTDSFDAHKFLYPAIRLSDDRVIPISQILNNPSAPISFTPNPALDIPGPDSSFVSMDV
jgi:hypothetical protein